MSSTGPAIICLFCGFTKRQFRGSIMVDTSFARFVLTLPSDILIRFERHKKVAPAAAHPGSFEFVAQGSHAQAKSDGGIGDNGEPATATEANGFIGAMSDRGRHLTGLSAHVPRKTHRHSSVQMEGLHR